MVFKETIYLTCNRSAYYIFSRIILHGATQAQWIKIGKISAKVDTIGVDQNSFENQLTIHSAQGVFKKKRNLLLAKKYFEFSKPFILQFFRLI